MGLYIYKVIMNLMITEKSGKIKLIDTLTLKKSLKLDHNLKLSRTWTRWFVRYNI